MREWFKARNVWGAAMTALSDDEAGRVAKAIWAYTMNGEIREIEGAGKGILALILMTLAQDAEHDADISAKRSDAAKSMHLQANAYKCKQLSANDDIKNKNKNKNKSKNKEQESESEEELIPVDEARRIQLDHDTLFQAAENAGFKMSNDVSTELIALYALHGMQKVMDGLKSCVEHGVPNLAYLKACLTGEPRKGKPVKAQQYEQRDYDEEQAEAMRRMIRAVNS